MKNNRIEWTPEDIIKLKEMYSHTNKQDIINAFKPRNWCSIEAKALRIGLSREVNKKIAWTTSEIDLIKEKYITSSKEYFMSLIPNRSWKSIREKANALGINRNKDVIKKDNVDIVKKNNLKNFGKEFSWQREDVQEKIKKTYLKKYGVSYPQQSKKIQNKTKENNLKKWGHECTLHSKNIRDSIKKNSMEKYGVENPGISKEANLKRNKTNLEKYGHINPFGNKDIKKRIRNTFLEKYGVDNPQKDENIRLKTYQTNLERYDFEHPAQNDDIKKKLKWDFEKRIKMANCIIKKAEGYDSFTEKIFIEYFIKEIDTNSKKKTHPSLGYKMDLYSPKYDLWIQIDGLYWHGKHVKDKEDLKKDPKFFLKGSRVQGVYRQMSNDIIQNRDIKNLIRFWEDDVISFNKKGLLFDLIQKKFLEKGISLSQKLSSEVSG